MLLIGLSLSVMIALIGHESSSQGALPREALAREYLWTSKDISRILASELSQRPPNAKEYAGLTIRKTQFTCLDKLWERESHWNHLAYSKSSGAYGIPQALPGSKMAKAGSDWMTNPITQVKWGLGYISGRYGTACNAWRFWQNNGWY